MRTTTGLCQCCRDSDRSRVCCRHGVCLHCTNRLPEDMRERVLRSRGHLHHLALMEARGYLISNGLIRA